MDLNQETISNTNGWNLLSNFLCDVFFADLTIRQGVECEAGERDEQKKKKKLEHASALHEVDECIYF